MKITRKKLPHSHTETSDIRSASGQEKWGKM